MIWDTIRGLIGSLGSEDGPIVAALVVGSSDVIRLGVEVLA